MPMTAHGLQYHFCLAKSESNVGPLLVIAPTGDHRSFPKCFGQVRLQTLQNLPLNANCTLEGALFEDFWISGLGTGPG